MTQQEKNNQRARELLEDLRKKYKELVELEGKEEADKFIKKAINKDQYEGS